MKWTEDQEKSIYAKPAEIVVSAAAGSGKTQVLTTRITERIKSTSSPVSVDRLLIVTFTKAAAAEMKERIAKSLREAVTAEADKEKRAYLKNQLSLLGSAKICTIDSFCYDVVKQNFFKANLPADISIGESGELSLLRLSALEETVDSLYCALEKSKGTVLSEENMLLAQKCADFFGEDELPLILSGFSALTDSCSYDKRDSEFTENIRGGGDYSTMITELYQKAQSAAFPNSWLDFCAEMYNPASSSYEETPFFEYALTESLRVIKDALSSLESAALLSEENGIGYEICIREDIEKLSFLLSQSDYDSLRNAYFGGELFGRLKGKKRNCDALLSEDVKNIRSAVKESVTSALSSLLEFSLKDASAVRKELYPQIKALCCAAKLLGEIYTEKTVARRIIDFSACEHFALSIISEDGETLSETGMAVKNKYDEIYIDEVQDSNELQDRLFSLISRGRTFMVGDVKQSIYGFRNADPSIFMKKCDDSQFDEDALKRKIFLSKNFRSGQSVISAVNSVFDIIMTLPVCGIDYKGLHRLDFGASFMPESVPQEKCEIAIIQKDGTSENQLRNEMEYICDEIENLISSKRTVWDKDTASVRPIRLCDIAVLMRSVAANASLCEKVFSQRGIPCYIDGGVGLFETSEVGQITEILNLIDNASNDIALACALRSPMFMFDENDLLKIKLSSRESFAESFYGICRGTYQADSSLTKKCRTFFSQLQKWRKAAGFVGISELIRRIYTDTGIYSSVLSFPDGQMRRANLDLLLEKAEEFERSSYSGLFNFVNYVQKIKKTSENTGSAKSVSEKMDVVRIMSIHKSKGLEFPIVFVASCAKSYHAPQTGAGGLIINSRAAIGMNVINPVLRCKYKSPMQSVLLHMAKRDDAKEEMRLFYVALTRAREKLYALCTLRDMSVFEKMQYRGTDRVTRNEIFGASSFCELLALSYGHGGDKFWSLKEVTPKEDTVTLSSSHTSVKDFCEDKKISALLNFEYPHKNAQYLPGKASVSFLKSFDINLAPSYDGNLSLINAPSSKKITLQKPSLDKNKSGAFYGTAHHKMLQYIDFKNADLFSQREKLFKKGILTKEEYEIINLQKLEEFLKSSLGNLLKNASEIHREESFVICVDANEITPDVFPGEKIYLQGIIDCYFVKDDSTVVLIDYKTDTYDDPYTVVKKYKKQLYYYETALKTKFKDKVTEKYLYLLHKNDIIRVED